MGRKWNEGKRAFALLPSRVDQACFSEPHGRKARALLLSCLQFVRLAKPPLPCFMEKGAKAFLLFPQRGPGGGLAHMSRGSF